MWIIMYISYLLMVFSFFVSLEQTTCSFTYITHPFQGAQLSADAPIENAKQIGQWSFEGSDRNIVQGIPYGDYGRATLLGRKQGKIGKCGSFNGRTE